jgi:hypothetical protein
MKKILLLFMMCAMLPMSAGAQGPIADTFTVSDLEQDGEGDYFFTVSLDGSQIYTAYNLDLYLPAGITVMGDGEEYYIYSTEDESFYPYTTGKGGKKTFKHQVSFRVSDGDSHIRLACSSNENADFKANSGDLFIVYVTIDNASLVASFSPKPIVKFSGLNLTKSDETAFHPADFACRPFTTGIPTSRTLPVNVSAENKIGTLILPFDAELPSGLKAYSCNAVVDDLLTLTSAASLEACKPYIVYAESGYSGNLSGTAELSDDSNVTDVFTEGYLTGVLTGTTVNTGYILQNQGSGPKFYDAEDVTFSLPAGRCYLTPPSGGEVKVFVFDLENTTSIEEMFNVQCSMFNTYDLQGRKVSSPQRGIYIQGTRKVVIK